MLRKLLLITCLLWTTLNVSAQKKSRRLQNTVPVAQATGSNDKTNYKEIGAPLPQLLVTKSSGQLITNKDVANNANLVLMLFNPTCSHCEEMTQLLQKNIFLFKESKILMVAAPLMKEYMPGFEKNYNIDQYASTMMVGIDSLGLIDKTFTYAGLPQLNIYNKERKLIKIFSGDVAIDSLKPYIQ